MRKLSELYTDVLKTFNSNQYSYVCICHSVIHAISSNDERQSIFTDLYKNRPALGVHSQFWNHPSYQKDKGIWWPAYEKEQRIKFLNHLITLHKEKENE